MPLAEVTLVQVGGAVAKALARHWLSDSPPISELGADIVDIFKSKGLGDLAAHRAQREFAEIGTRVAESLVPAFDLEDSSLDDAEKTAVALEIANTLTHTPLAVENLVAMNLDPVEVARYLNSANPKATEMFSATGSALYHHIIAEVSRSIVDISSRLPRFTERSIGALLSDQGKLANIAQETLDTVRRIEATNRLSNPELKGSRFEIDYLLAVGRNLNVLQLFGVDTTTSSRRYPLSVAYVSLVALIGAGGESGNNIQDLRPDAVDVGSTSSSEPITVDYLLSYSNRLLIRGDAGSGKSTLLQWIAVRAAEKKFHGPLASWNSVVPFLIKLRQHVQSELPPPQAFPKLVAPSIADAMPAGWVHSRLETGEAVVLIDGLDEVPRSKREAVRAWITDLISTFPKARYVLTSRPYALSGMNLTDLAFKEAELQPMSLADIDALIDHWHTAVGEGLPTLQEKQALVPTASHLKQVVRADRSIQLLATSPLLCAMLCALHHHRFQQLPSDRVDLYEAACEMLIERRESERGIDLQDYPVFTYRQKRALLEDLAYYLLKNGWSEIDAPAADMRFKQRSNIMGGDTALWQGADIRRLFVERTGIIREPVHGYIDFTHRTFQEYLAARAAIEERDIGVLSSHAHDDQWSQVVILAAGLAGTKDRSQLIRELVLRGDNEPAYRHQLHLLAIACLEDTLGLEDDARSIAEQRLASLLPPNNMTEAQALASAGELAVPLLANSGYRKAVQAAACVRALSLIGSNSAIEAIASYARDNRQTVRNEILRSWGNSASPRDFGRVVFAALSTGYGHARTRMRLRNPATLAGLEFAVPLSHLVIEGYPVLRDIGPLAALSNLDYLYVHALDPEVSLEPISHLTDLKQLRLVVENSSLDLSFLVKLKNLKSLHLVGFGQMADIAPLANLTQLTDLRLAGFGGVTDIAPLANLTQLTDLRLAGFYDVRDLGPIAMLKNLKQLRLSGKWQDSETRQLGVVRTRNLYSEPGSFTVEYPEEVWGLRNPPHSAAVDSMRYPDSALNYFWDFWDFDRHMGFTDVDDLSPLGRLTQLEELYLAGLVDVPSIEPLATMKRLKRLHLSEMIHIDSLRPLKFLRELGQLHLEYMENVRTLEPLASLPQLRQLSVYGCDNIADFSEALRHTDLWILGTTGDLERLRAYVDEHTDLFPH